MNKAALGERTRVTRLEPSYGQDGKPKPAAIDTRDAQFTLDLVKAICTDLGPGLLGHREELP
jgi:hypothetical protein